MPGQRVGIIGVLDFTTKAKIGFVHLNAEQTDDLSGE